MLATIGGRNLIKAGVNFNRPDVALAENEQLSEARGKRALRALEKSEDDKSLAR